MGEDRTIAVLGLGLMGNALAENLLGDGWTVVGYDPVGRLRTEHEQRGGVVASSEAEAADRSDLVILSLPNGAIGSDVCERLAGSRRSGLLVVDTTTCAPAESIAAARRLAEAAISFVDATISGNAAQARARDLVFMVGGADADVARATAVLETLGRSVHPVGPVGAGARAKLVVNHVLAVNRAALAEGLTVAELAGLDLDAVLAVLMDGAAHSKAMDIWGQRMIDGDHHPPTSRVRQNHKDLLLIGDHIAQVGASGELLDAVERLLTEAEEGGLSDADNSAVIEVLRRRAGVGRLRT